MCRECFKCVREKADACGLTEQVGKGKKEEIHTYKVKIIREEIGEMANSNTTYEL